MLLHLFIFLQFAFPQWNENTILPIDGLRNPYNLDSNSLVNSIYRGKVYALNYPVEVTGLLLPYTPTKKALNADSNNPIIKSIYELIKGAARVKNFDSMNEWLGLHKYPTDYSSGIPFALRDEVTRMGFTLKNWNGVDVFTHSCAACHSADLFGRKILGLTNRFPRANEYFLRGKLAFKVTRSKDFQRLTNATDEEIKIFERSQWNLNFVNAVQPQVLGLDTSLAHVALSLSHRDLDDYATKNILRAYFPRQESLSVFVADSKPAVWWNVKYKNKWLLDGSVVSGNPIFTNILWNEIGRGTDLKELESWMSSNSTVIEDLTNAVYNSQAPHMTEFFSREYFDIQKAELGRKVFEKGKCSECHGNYKKNWELGITHWPDAFKTYQVEYPEDTKIKNVGTDPQRWQGMKSLVQLNNLAISKNNNIRVKHQEGYVPPPLVGIWARWPYFHNNSVPNLCELFTPPYFRVSKYYSGPAQNQSKDFDFECNGYPVGAKTPKEWIKNEHLYDTSRMGLSNKGHYKMFLKENGDEKFSQEEKRALIHFLQTL